MKKLTSVLLAALLSAGAYAADQVPLFNATLSMGKEHHFMLVNAEGKNSSWLKLGDSFENYTIKAFDAAGSTLDLERDGKIVKVKLAGDAAVTNAPVPVKATLADATALMNKVHLDDVLERAVAQQRKMIGNSVGGIGKNFPNAAPEDIATLEKNIMELVDASLDPVKMKEDVTKIYSEAFSKDELERISSFYDTPLGQVLLAKQPEIQQKTQAAMMARAGNLGPKIQQMAKDFAMDQKAKRDAAQAAAGATPAPTPGTP